MRTGETSSSRGGTSRCARSCIRTSYRPLPHSAALGTTDITPQAPRVSTPPHRADPNVIGIVWKCSQLEASFYRILQDEALRLLTKVRLGMQINSRSTPVGDANRIDSIRNSIEP